MEFPQVSHRDLTYAVVYSRAFLSAKRRKEIEVHCTEGTRIAFSGGGDYQVYDLIRSVLDVTHQKYPDMVLLHGDTPKGAEMIAARWVDSRAEKGCKEASAYKACSIWRLFRSAKNTKGRPMACLLLNLFGSL